MDDSRIIELYFDRNEAAIEQTSAKYGSYCYAVANRILALHEDTEECVNDTWVRAWNAIPPARPSCLRAFLGKITRNLALDRYRHNARRQKGAELAIDELAECIPSGERVDDRLLAAELASAINRFLGELSDRDRDLFVARFFYLRSAEEIAERVGMTRGGVANSLTKTKKKLKIFLKKEGWE